MSLVLNSLAVCLVILGLVTMLVGSIGVIRLPDFFTRTHAASMVDTVGIIILLLGLAIYENGTLNSAKLVLATGFIAVTNPAAIHALGRAAIRMGVKPWSAREPEKGKHELED